MHIFYLFTLGMTPSSATMFNNGEMFQNHILNDIVPFDTENIPPLKNIIIFRENDILLRFVYDAADFIYVINNKMFYRVEESENQLILTPLYKNNEEGMFSSNIYSDAGEYMEICVHDDASQIFDCDVIDSDDTHQINNFEDIDTPFIDYKYIDNNQSITIPIISNSNFSLSSQYIQLDTYYDILSNEKSLGFKCTVGGESEKYQMQNSNNETEDHFTQFTTCKDEFESTIMFSEEDKVVGLLNSNHEKLPIYQFINNGETYIFSKEILEIVSLHGLTLKTPVNIELTYNVGYRLKLSENLDESQDNEITDIVNPEVYSVDIVKVTIFTGVCILITIAILGLRFAKQRYDLKIILKNIIKDLKLSTTDQNMLKLKRIILKCINTINKLKEDLDIQIDDKISESDLCNLFSNAPDKSETSENLRKENMPISFVEQFVTTVMKHLKININPEDIILQEE